MVLMIDAGLAQEVERRLLASLQRDRLATRPAIGLYRALVQVAALAFDRQCPPNGAKPRHTVPVPAARAPVEARRGGAVVGGENRIDARSRLAEVARKRLQGLEDDGRIAAVAEAPAQFAGDLARVVGEIGKCGGREAQERTQTLELAAGLLHDPLP